MSTDEMMDYCCRSATEQTDTSLIGLRRTCYYKKHSWSGSIEAISRCVAAYQRAADSLETMDCEDIVHKLKQHVQALLQKCVTHAYLQWTIMGIITDYMEQILQRYGYHASG